MKNNILKKSMIELINKTSEIEDSFIFEKLQDYMDLSNPSEPKWTSNVRLRMLEIHEARLNEKQKILKEVSKVLIESYKKCLKELDGIKNQKPRENNTPRDWEQRLDEIVLNYSAIFGLSCNEVKDEIKKEFGNGNEGKKHPNYKHGKYSRYINEKICDMPKLLSPFKRKIDKNGNYILYDEIEEGYSWVFEDESVMAIEKLNGTCVSILIQEGTVTEIYNRTERIPFINKGKKWLIEGILNSKERGYLEFLGDGQHFGELIGPKVNGNPYKLNEHLWIPFSTYCQKHLKYKSWGKYPKDFKTISEWFKELLPLYASMKGDRENGFVEGVVFTHPDGRMAKLRRDMFDWFKGKRHNDGYSKKNLK